MPRHENDAPNTPALKRSWQWRRAISRWLKSLTGQRQGESPAKG
jgi:hypothetical protein